MRINPFISCSFLLWPTVVLANEPLSAIDWLTQTQTPTVTLEMALPSGEAPISESNLVPDVAVTALGKTGRGGVGLLPSSVTGLPTTLWRASSADVLSQLIEAQDTSELPALQALLYTLLLAEVDTPIDNHTRDDLLLARIDKLVELGALEQANALIERAGVTSPDLFERWFNVTLLIGEEARACDVLATRPSLTRSYAARIFCTARAGDWNGAALMLNTAKTLDLISEQEDALLLRYLDPNLFEHEPLLFAQTDTTPLSFRLHEAIGEPLPTASLPRPYAHADLRSSAGWKAQLEAGEKLARTGALPGNHLLGIYTERKPAASGMIWSRVSAIQALDKAMQANDLHQISATLPPAWRAMQEARLEVTFANIYGPALLHLKPEGDAASIARKIALLSPDYELAAQLGPQDFLAGLAIGDPPRTPTDATARAIADAFHGAGVPQSLSTHLALGQLGEVILRAMLLLSQGAEGDLQALTDALAALRALGLEETARRAALQIMIIKARG